MIRASARIAVAWLVVLACISLSGPAHAALVTTSNFNPVLNASGTFTLGNWIQIGASPITINALGVQDTSTDGILANTAVGIWNANGSGVPGSLLASVTVPAGTGALLLNDYRYVQLGAPITLTAGANYVIGASSATNGTAENAGEGSPGSIYAGDTGVTIMDSRFIAGAALTAPTTVGGSGAAVGRWGPANGALVPEPASLALAGFAALTLLPRRRRHSSHQS